MNQELKEIIDGFFDKLKAGGHAAAVEYVQYFIQKIPPETLLAMMKELKPRELVKFQQANIAAWKKANELSAAECKVLLDAFGEILFKLIGLAFGS